MKDTFDLISGGAVLPAVMPADLGAGAIQGSWASLANVGDCGILLVLASGAAGNGPVIALEQATDAAGTDAKALPISNLRYLAAADVQAAVGGDWDKVESLSRTAPVASFDTDAVGGDTNELMVFVRVHEGDLDSGFTHFRINSAAAGGNRQGYVLYIAKDKLFKGEPDPNLAD